MNKYTFSFQNFRTISAFGRDNITIQLLQKLIMIKVIQQLKFGVLGN